MATHRSILTLIIGAGGLSASHLADGAVTTDKIADDAINSAKIAANAVGSSEVAADAIGASEISADAIGDSELDTTVGFNFTGDIQKSGASITAGANLYYCAVDCVQSTNITLSGGAPNSVQGHSLSQNEDVLVTGQNTTSQNGIYNVDTVGTGSNGTWTRDTTRDAANEYPVGLLVYDKNQQKLYKLTAFSGTLGTDALTFEEHEEGMQVAGNGEPIALGTGDGSTLTFDMPAVATIIWACVLIDGMAQDPSTWAINAGAGAGGVDRLTFTSGNAPSSGAKIELIAFTRS